MINLLTFKITTLKIILALSLNLYLMVILSLNLYNNQKIYFVS